MLAGLLCTVPRDNSLLVAVAAHHAALFVVIFSKFSIFFTFFVAFFLILIFIVFFIFGTITEAELFGPVGLEVAATRQSFRL